MSSFCAFCLFSPWLQASELIVKYDEHNLSHAFKFGVIYQKKGQVILLHTKSSDTKQIQWTCCNNLFNFWHTACSLKMKST